MCKLLVLKLETEKKKKRRILESQENLHKRASELSLDPKEAIEVGDKTLFLF